VPLDALITGRIATLAGDAGFGWVEAIGIRAGRVAFAGTEVYLETRADPFTERFRLEPDEVAIPGLTDAHLHLAQAALATRHLDLTTSPSLADGLRRIGATHERLAKTDPEAWIQGHGWDSDRWGGWPRTIDLELVAPGRRIAIWAHDHHALWVSAAAMRSGGVSAATDDPSGGIIRRTADGEPEGVLHDAAARLVTVHIPPASDAELETALVAAGRELVELGVVAVHDPGPLAPDPDLAFSFPAYAHLSDTARLPVRVHACLRDDSLSTALAGGLRSGDVLGSDPAGRARIGWQKCFADGSMGSRTARLLEDIELEPGSPLPPDRRRGLWMTEPAVLEELVQRAAAGGIATQIHAIGDAAVRAALDLLTPDTGPSPRLMHRIEHVQMLHPADRSRFAASHVAASVQPVHLATDAATARRLWGTRAEERAYAWGSLARTGAVVAFGTDAPIEPIDPWPGIAFSVTRSDPGWPAGEQPFAPTEALTLDRALRAACVDAAISAGELDRGRLVVGHRADLVVLPAAALREPVEPGGALATARPNLVLMDGRVVFER
jgi:predicted amidohydrolase YtcJ